MDDLGGLSGSWRGGDDDDLVLGECVEELAPVGPHGKILPPLKELAIAPG